MMKNKKAAMEMSVGTIVTIVLLMAVLVLGLTLTKKIFVTSTDSINTIDDQVKNEINTLFDEGEDNLVVSLGNQNTAKIKQGTENFGIAIGFSPDDPGAWKANKQGCKYSIEVSQSGTYCVKSAWPNLQNSIKTGINDVIFDKVDSVNGYALIKLDVPETVSPCLQRFNILVECTGKPEESSTNFFDVEVLKKGLFK